MLIAKGGTGVGVTVEVGLGEGVSVSAGAGGNACVGVVIARRTVGIIGCGLQLDSTTISKMLNRRPKLIKNRNPGEYTAFKNYILLKLVKMLA